MTFRRNLRGPIDFVADITTASDRGLEDQYPVRHLSDLLHKRLRNLGLVGTISYKVGGVVVDKGRGKKRVELGIPKRTQIASFVEEQIIPWFKRIRSKGLQEDQAEFRFSEKYPLVLTYRRNTQYASGSHLSFTAAYSRTNNPIYNVLKRKAEQLRDSGFEGCKGIFICDAGCTLMKTKQVGAGTYSDKQVIDAFLRNNTSIAFVVTVYVIDQLGKARKLEGKVIRNSNAKCPFVGATGRTHQRTNSGLTRTH